MKKIKDAYDIKKQLIDKDINELGNILKKISNIETIDVNPDNTIYLESNCGVDSIKDSINEGIKRWVNINESIMYNMIFNTLPLSNNSCILKA